MRVFVDCGAVHSVTSDDEAAGTWSAVLRAHTHTHTCTHAHTLAHRSTVEANEKEQWAERASGRLA